MEREKGCLSRERKEWAEWARGWGNLAVAPFESVQNQHSTQEGLAPLLSDPRFLPQEVILEAAM